MPHRSPEHIAAAHELTQCTGCKILCGNRMKLYDMQIDKAESELESLHNKLNSLSQNLLEIEKFEAFLSHKLLEHGELKNELISSTDDLIQSRSDNFHRLLHETNPPRHCEDPDLSYRNNNFVCDYVEMERPNQNVVDCRELSETMTMTYSHGINGMGSGE